MFSHVGTIRHRINLFIQILEFKYPEVWTLNSNNNYEIDNI